MSKSKYETRADKKSNASNVVSTRPETKKSLPIALIKCLKTPFLAAIVPRLLLISFRYSQPVLINESIRYIVTHSKGEGSNHGFWLIVSAFTIYVGLALSTAVYQHFINRLKLMTRSALVGLIHEKTMNSPGMSYDNGDATSLMSNDAESLDAIAEMFHQTWAQVIEVLVGISLLATQVGWIWPLPLFLIYSNALGIFSPAITLAMFALISQAHGVNLDTETAFTTMAILSMVTHPANMVMTIVPRVVAAFAGLAIQIHKLKIDHKQMILDDINIQMHSNSFNIVSGPTGSGKTTLLRTIIGEVVPVGGSIALTTRKIAYCAQRPWLPSGSIKEAIYGANDIYGPAMQDHETWYNTITETCCLAHDFDSLPQGDQTEIGSRGLNLSGGQRQRVTLARALFARSDILLLDDTFSGLDGDTEQTIFDNLFGSNGLLRRLKTTVVLVSNSSQYFQSADHVVVLGYHGIIDQGNWQTIKFETGSIAKFSSGNRSKDNLAVSAAFDKLSSQVQAKDEAEIDLARQSGDFALYGNPLPSSSNGNAALYATGFLFLSFMSWIITSLQMCAPLSYFSQTDNGSILNRLANVHTDVSTELKKNSRFGQDIQLVDKQLPSALQTVITQIFKLSMQVILLFVAQKWLTVSLPACMAVVYIVQKVYLRTSRQLRFLELEARAGVFSSFLESVEGLETIRSFGWSNAVIKDNIISVDNAQRPEFLLLCLQRWLNIVLDLLAAAVATFVIAITVAFRDRISGAQVGIALNIMLVANTTLLKLVESWTTLEVSLGAIARLRTLEKMTPLEGAMAWNFEPTDSWPSRGDIEIKNITASYLHVQLCGSPKLDTLLLTLLRLLGLQSGHIVLDGVDIKNVGLDVLRQRCFITVSQDPLLLFSETLRFNLDPDASSSNEALIASLKRAGLWSHFMQEAAELDEILRTESGFAIDVSPYNQHPILDKTLSLFSGLSVGQGQLLALCRALVKAQTAQHSGRKPVVLLDEVTSSLDPVTESAIYDIIDDEFTRKGHTVICVAHRIDVLSKHIETGRDVVVLLSNGRLQEVITDLNTTMLERLGRLD
ncbi:hypothetical protein SS1G_11032 [Sclerotinia sclerotiorum 1980 UF-70]|uniref:ABC transporter n=1 Tax=Sclerotinia sclerotiorum (strain ATCC 18683 / 1980 / Ss-1) TaxID=665079 RepID=A7F0B5_SCLS1|nr:hypothetical protein SS1G_11032 [Sclerotinia sclerotiorum 1980 UF-70]EDN95157.1 hypothetical protein SS1G_11032 [Sclerotinia sclerotiorum 1980 UF-70]